MLGSISAALPRHGRFSACATRHAGTERPRGLTAGEPGIPAADGRGPLRSGTVYLLWYAPVVAINLLLLDWVSANTLVSAEAALLNLVLTVGFRTGDLAVALPRATVWPLRGRAAGYVANRMAHQPGARVAEAGFCVFTRPNRDDGLDAYGA